MVHRLVSAVIMLLAAVIQAWSWRGDYKTIRLKHETFRAQQMNELQNISQFEPDSAASEQLLIYPQVTEMWADGDGDDRGARRTTQGPCRETDQLHGQREHL